jgi:adenine deaminase
MTPMAETLPRLVEVAAGRAPADLVVRGGRWVNVHSGEVLPDSDLAITAGRFAYCGPDAGFCVGERTRVIEAEGRYMVPGLIDAHMHVESGMVTVTEFCRAVAPHGATTMMIDPHEIANVLGLEGVRLMHDEAAAAFLNVFVQAPSCVPSAPGLETAGAALGPSEIAEMMGWPNIVGLGEVMNFPGVAAGDAAMLGEIAATLQAGKTVGGHYASPDLGRAFHAYAAAGPADDHEGVRMEDAVARVRQGMRAMLRLGSAWRDVADQIRAVTEMGLDPRGFVLCTDDCHAGTLAREGHVDRAVREAIRCGLRPVTAIQMATLNAAQHFGLERELGSIAPGRRADLFLTSDLAALPVETVVARGLEVAEGGRLTLDVPAWEWPAHVRRTVRLPRPPRPEAFRVPAPEGAAGARARVIGVVENQAPTRALERTLPCAGGEARPDPAQDVARIAVVERHKGTGAVSNGFVHGFGYDRPCALASTVAHDCHQIVVVGTSERDMAAACARLAELGGGAAMVSEGRVLAEIPMPIAGLMSDKRADAVAAEADALLAAMRDCGCRLSDGFMQHSLLALAVIPELRLTDQGLVDVARFERVEALVGTG